LKPKILTMVDMTAALIDITASRLQASIILCSHKKAGDIISPMDAIKSVVKILRAPSIALIALGAWAEPESMQPATKAPSS